MEEILIEYGAPGEIRTPDHLVRSQVLYPAELRALNFFIAETVNPEKGYAFTSLRVESNGFGNF
jgi:hypothetical protein